MEIIKSIQQMRDFVALHRKQGKKIGLVPTMGFLHTGHLSLVEIAKQQAEVVVMSIFVNPLQFGVGEDFEEYPRDLTRDAELADSVGVAAIFAPTAAEMYPGGYASFVEVERLTEGLCGRSRPGHFRGVTTVVCKLFNIVQPDLAVFGQKDAQQAIIIKTMVKDLNLPLEIIVAPIVRESDGLALSSRNVYLDEQQRKAGLVLSKSLKLAQQRIEAGVRSRQDLHSFIEGYINQEPLAKIDYVEIVSAEDLLPQDELCGRVLIALAVRFGNTRLIDNAVVEV